MNLNQSTATALRLCIILGIVIIASGLILMETSIGDTVLTAGIFVLICSPIVSIAVTYAALLKEKDWKWVKVATVLIIVLAVGIIYHLL